MKYFVLIALMVLCCAEAESQSNLSIREIVPNDNLVSTLQGIHDSQRNCEFFDRRLIYLVSDVKETSTHKVSITLIEGLEFLPDYMFDDIMGFFEFHGMNVLIVGESLNGLIKQKSEKREFVIDHSVNVYPSDYSIWIYVLEQKNLRELESYELPCN